MEVFRKVITYIALVLCVALPFLHLADTLVHYAPHTDGGSLVLYSAFFFAAIAFVIGVQSFRRNRKAQVITSVIAVVLCLAICVVAARIPFCPACDDVSKEEIGFLSHWIKDDYWGD